MGDVLRVRLSFLGRLCLATWSWSREGDFVFTNIGGILEAEGGSYRNLTTMTVFLTEGGRDAYNTVNETRARIFGDARPASTMVVVRELAQPSHKIEVNATALLDS